MVYCTASTVYLVWQIKVKSKFGLKVKILRFKTHFFTPKAVTNITKCVHKPPDNFIASCEVAQLFAVKVSSQTILGELDKPLKC